MNTSVPIGFMPDGEPIYQFRGAERGYSTEGDVLVNQTADGIDLNTIWEEVRAVVALYNEERSAYASLLSFPTTAIAEPIAQSVGGDSFEEASEFGVPEGIRQPGDSLLVGYGFSDWDLRIASTWRFLRGASAQAVEAVFTRALEADNKLTTGSVLDRLFNPTELLSPENHRVFGLYTGTDGITPPPYLGKAFPQTTNHYVTSQSAVLDSGDVEDLIRLVQAKGFGRGSSGTQLVIMASAAEAEVIQTWKKGVGNGTGDAFIAKHDFVPSASSDPYLTLEAIVGQIPAGEYSKIRVLGQYGPALLLEPSQFVPEGYVAVVATGGPNSSANVVGFREHVNPAYQGLRLIPGHGPYPLQDSFLARGFGTGVRHRGAAAVCQVTAATAYTAPVVPR